MAAKSKSGTRKPPQPARAATRRRPDRIRKAPLDLRRAPLQSRGQATFDQILDTTARLLDDLGLESVNTNAIAKSAGINVATLYQYFPNKQAVLLALYMRHSRQRADTARELFSGIGRNPDWPAQIDAMVEGMARLRARLPGLAALMQAMRIDPELREHHFREGERIAALFAEELARSRRLSIAEARLVARCAIEVNVALIDLWRAGPRRSNRRILDELKQVHRLYLGRYLSAPARRRGAGRPRPQV